jgi:NADPH:quinone reductase-like Zn-dependent oxidoreductase
MKAIVITKPGGPDVLQLQEVECSGIIEFVGKNVSKWKLVIG